MAVATQEEVCLDLEYLLADGAGSFGAQQYLWRALRARGKVMAGEEGFSWGALCLVTCDAAGVDPRIGIGFSAAVECLVAALDVLDDIQDADAPDALWRECGVATATNVATLLLFLSQLAVSRLAQRGAPTESVAMVARTLAEAGVRACTGQQRDLDQTHQPLMDETAYLAMVGRKSASIVEGICRSAAILACVGQGDVETFAQFGFNIGMAMQIMNDVAGISTEQARRNDLPQGKRSLPLIFALECSAGEVRGELADLMQAGQKGGLTPDGTARIWEILDSTGALHYAIAVADIYWERALACLTELNRERAARLLDFLAQARGD